MNREEEITKLVKSKEDAITNFVNWQLETFKGSNKEILTFIARILYQQGEEGSETIRYLFHAGYCYYFAVMLKDAFGGEICWHKGYSHIVWKDTSSDICYDIEGVFYDYNEEDIVPADFLKSDLESFRHRGKDSLVKDEMEAECKRLNIHPMDLEKRIFDIIPENERVYKNPNTGDARRYWDEYKKRA